MKRWTKVGAAVVVVGLGVAGWIRFGGAKKQAPTTFETARVERGRISARVTATGTLSALVTVQVGSVVSGRIASLHADFNSRVKKGEVIAKIDPQLFRATVEQARANHAAALGNLERFKVAVDDAQKVHDRTKALADQKLAPQQELDTAYSTLQAAKAQVVAQNGVLQQAKAALHQAEINLAYTTIVSPIDGVVISRSVDVGQTVAASLQAPTLFTIAEDLRKMQVDTSVAEADVGKLKSGMSVTFTVDAYPGEKFAGKVRQIRNAPQTVQNVVTYDAVIDVENPELKLKPGMTSNVTFVYAERESVLRVPNAALRFRPSPDMLAARAGAGGAGGVSGAGGAGGATATAGAGGATAMPGGMPSGRPPYGKRPPHGADVKKQVYVMRPGATTPEAVEVKTGVTDGATTEIVGGAVKEGDLVVTDASTPGAAPSAPGGQPPFRRMF